MSECGEVDSPRSRREAAARKYQPDRIAHLLVAEAPPSTEDRYFYFEHVQSNDWLFVGVAEVILGEKTRRADKARALAELKERGVFLIDLNLDPVDGSDLSEYVPDLVSRCKALRPARIVLIKATVFDAAYGSLRAAGLPVVNQRIYFPSTGRQADFRRQFTAAIREVST